MTAKSLNILMITHHKRSKAIYRSQTIARYLVERGHRVTLIVTADERKFGVVDQEWDEVRVMKIPGFVVGQAQVRVGSLVIT